MDREELEAELWRLRSVEIDLERCKADLDVAEIARRAAVNNETKLTKERDEAVQKVDQTYGLLKATEREVEERNKTIEKLSHERDWAMKRLEDRERAEYMYNNYGVHVTDKMPSEQQARRGWRLSR